MKSESTCLQRSSPTVILYCIKSADGAEQMRKRRRKTRKNCHPHVLPASIIHEVLACCVWDCQLPPRAEGPLSTSLIDLIECGLICTCFFPIKAHKCPKRFVFPSRLCASSPSLLHSSFYSFPFFSCLSLPPWQSSILSPSIEAALENSELPLLKWSVGFLLKGLNPS